MNILMFLCSIFSFYALATNEGKLLIENKLVELSSEQFSTKKESDYYYVQPKAPIFNTVGGRLTISEKQVELEIGGFKNNFSYQYTQVDYERYIERFTKLLKSLDAKDEQALLKLIEDFAPSVDINKTINISPILVNDPYITAILISGLNVRDSSFFSHELYFLTEKELISLSYFTDKKHSELVKNK